MKLETLSVPTYYLHLVAEELATAGVDVSAWLADRISVGSDQWGDALAGLPFHEFRRLLTDAAQLLGRDLGLRIGVRLRLQHHGMLGYAAMSASSLRQVAELFQRFCPLRTPLVPSVTRDDGHEFCFVFEGHMALAGIDHLMYDAVVLGMKNVFDQMAKNQIADPVSYVAFAFERPDDGMRHEAIFNCPVLFGQSWTGLALPSSKVDLPLSSGDMAGYREAVRLCEREMETIGWQASWTSRVGRLLETGAPQAPSLAIVAQQLHVSPRTLHRRLADEGTSYKALWEKSMHRKALSWLRMPKRSVQEVAFELGYTDVANFRRAFKRWEGIAPSVYRAGTAVE